MFEPDRRYSPGRGRQHRFASCQDIFWPTGERTFPCASSQQGTRISSCFDAAYHPHAPAEHDHVPTPHESPMTKTTPHRADLYRVSLLSFWFDIEFNPKPSTAASDLRPATLTRRIHDSYITKPLMSHFTHFTDQDHLLCALILCLLHCVQMALPGPGCPTIARG